MLALFKAGSALARVLPPPVVDGLSRAAGFGAARISPARRAQVERNLRRVDGPDYGGGALRRSVGETFESYARFWPESFRLPGTSAEALGAAWSTKGWS